MPSSRWCGVREVPVPVVPGALATARKTLLAYFDGWPYGVKGAPGVFIHGSTGSASAAPVLSVNAALPIAAAPAVRKRRRSRSPFPAACSGSLGRLFLRIVSSELAKELYEIIPPRAARGWRQRFHLAKRRAAGSRDTARPCRPDR